MVDPHSDGVCLAATGVAHRQRSLLIDDNTLMELATEVNLSPTLGLIKCYPNASEIATQRPFQSSNGTYKRPGLNFPPDTEITFIPTPVNLATGYLHWGKLAGVPAVASAAGVGWWGANRWLQSALISPQDTITPESTQILSSTQTTINPIPSFQLKNKTGKLRDRRQHGYKRQILC